MECPNNDAAKSEVGYETAQLGKESINALKTKSTKKKIRDDSETLQIQLK